MRHLIVLGLLGFVTMARPAHACLTVVEYAPPRTLPAQGQEGVPTDVAMLVELSAMHLDPSDPLSGLCTLRTLDGVLVPSTTERVADWHAEVRPAAALASGTSYELAIRVPLEDGSVVTETVTFTTGTGPLEAELSPPVGLLQHWVISPDVPLNSCDRLREGTCVALPAGELVEATALHAGGVEAPGASLHDGPFTHDLTGRGSFECIRLRRRAMNGTYSEPSVLCGADAPSVELSGPELSCTTDGIHGDVALEPACAMTPGMSSQTSLAALATLAVLALRRRRPARSCP
jgi:hypothetical protein